MIRRHWYVDDHADETMPCAPTLEAWAEWLSKPDDSWEHEIPADGATFKVSTIDELCELTATKADGRWTLSGDPPADATGFVCRMDRAGWDADTWSDTPLGHFEADTDFGGDNAWYDDGDTEVLVCTRAGPSFICRFDADGPRLVVVSEVQ